MSMCRRFKGAPVMRLIVSVPTETVARVKALLSNRQHPSRGCRAEFVRLAIAEKLARDLMNPEVRQTQTLSKLFGLTSVRK